MTHTALTGGFQDAPRDAALAFRAAMTAMARPGRIERVTGAAPPAPLSVAAGTLILTLCDADTPLCLLGTHDCADVRDWVTFHTGAPFTDAAEAMFALGAWPALMPLDRFAIGTPEYPDRSATLIVEMDALTPHGARLTGPGIRDVATLSLPDPAAFGANARRFPLGLDWFLTCGDSLAAVPRTTRVEAH
jgi:alpha-D-ribose 1-methylphosphonate 5-triphosphate synthase subunit PhnH